MVVGCLETPLRRADSVHYLAVSVPAARLLRSKAYVAQAALVLHSVASGAVAFAAGVCSDLVELGCRHFDLGGGLDFDCYFADSRFDLRSDARVNSHLNLKVDPFC